MSSSAGKQSHAGSDVPLVRRTSSGSRATLHADPASFQEQSLAKVSSKQFYGLLIATFVAGIACIVASLVGLSIWGQADYFHDPGPYAYNSWCGYDRRTFAGLVAFTVFPTVGFTLVYVALETALRVQRQTMQAMAYLSFGAVVLSIGAAGMVWGNETMKCLGVFCVNMETYTETQYARPEAGIGFLSMIGITAFASLVPVGLVMFAIALKRLAFRSRRSDGPVQSSTVLQEDHNFIGSSFAGVVFFVLLGLFGIVTLYIPNSWEYFVAARIAKNAKLIVVTNATICNTYYNQYTCTEVPWAYMVTKNWQVSENLNLKFYPSNVVFYAYLLTLVGFAVLLRMNRRGRLFIKSHVMKSRFTVGELVTMALTVTMVVLFFIYWIHDHNYNGYWQGGTDPSILPAERWARSSGQVAVVFMGLLFFPASRNSVVHKIFGTSWEASLWAHRVLGYCMLAATFAHMVAWWKFYDIKHFFPQDIFDVPMMLPTSIDNFTVPLSTLAAWLMFLCMGVFALEPIRRRFFELFYYSHILAAYFALPVVLWHAAAGWEYLLPGATVWFMDRLIRMYRGGTPVQVVDLKVYRDVTEVRFLQPAMTAAPGQFAFINIPEIALYEWHPFTLSTGAHSNEFTLHIKSMGPGTWTQRLHELAVSGTQLITLAVDGPYGAPFNASDFKKVILVAGGIGITPCASIFSFIKDHPTCSASLLWSLREEETAAAFTEHLSTVHAKQRGGDNNALPEAPTSNAKVFLTKPSGGEGTASILSQLAGVDVFLSRPTYDQELQFAAIGLEPHDVLVFVCGPEPMVADVMRLSLQFGYHFHRETFLL